MALKKIVPFVPSSDDRVEIMLDMAKVGKKDTLIDLGCGDGRIVIAAAKRGAKSIGIDIDPQRLKECRKNSSRAGVKDRVRFVRQDFFDADIARATVVTMYLLPRVNLKLLPKLLRDLDPGTKIISHAFDMGEWKPDNRVNDIYAWTVPANSSGNWIMELSDGNKMVLNINQRFQKIKGSILIGERVHSLRFTKLQGSLLEFTVKENQSREKKEYKCRCILAGDFFQGEMGSEREFIKMKARRDPFTKRSIYL